MANEMTQGEMAEALDVSVKRYREIEKGNTRASAEVVAALYENLGYLPSIILEEDVVNLSSLNLIWEEFEEELQKELEAFIRKGCGLWECRPGGRLK
ncbi:helix-turn-helix transcriptional regulator [Blautia sp. RD014234]|nr:helix-turn-helix transcriptional regulator [Blautia parvula]